MRVVNSNNNSVTDVNCLPCLLQNMLVALVMLRIASHRHGNRSEFLNLSIDSDFWFVLHNCYHNHQWTSNCGIFSHECQCLLAARPARLIEHMHWQIGNSHGALSSNRNGSVLWTQSILCSVETVPSKYPVVLSIMYEETSYCQTIKKTSSIQHVDVCWNCCGTFMLGYIW